MSRWDKPLVYQPQNSTVKAAIVNFGTARFTRTAIFGSAAAPAAVQRASSRYLKGSRKACSNAEPAVRFGAELCI
jgi:hypothetical protein